MIRIPRVVENIISLITIKGFEYILNFLIMPFLIRTVGIEKFGQIAFAQSIIAYFTMFCNYGFDLSGSRDIAQSCPENKKLIFSSIMYSKLALLLFSTLIFVLILYISNKFFHVDVTIYFLGYAMTIGYVLFPIWFFQGIQKMRYITLANLVAKVLSVLCLFYFVKIPEDYKLAMFFLSITPLIAGIVSWVIIYREFRNLLTIPSISNVLDTLKKGWPIFISILSINIYTTGNITILGLLTNDAIVGYFSSANRLIESIKNVMSPIQQAVYPYFSRLSKQDHHLFISKLRMFLIILIFTQTIATLILMFFSDSITFLLFGTGFSRSAYLIKLLSFIPIVVAISNVYGIHYMLNCGMENVFKRIIFTAAVVNLIFIFPMVYYLSDVGACLTINIVELYITVMCVYFVHKQMGTKLLF